MVSLPIFSAAQSSLVRPGSFQDTCGAPSERYIKINHMGVLRRYPNGWMIYNGKSHKNGWFRGNPILENLHIASTYGKCTKSRSTCDYDTDGNADSMRKEAWSFQQLLSDIRYVLADKNSLVINLPWRYFRNLGWPAWHPIMKLIPRWSVALPGHQCQSTGKTPGFFEPTQISSEGKNGDGITCYRWCHPKLRICYPHFIEF